MDWLLSPWAIFSAFAGLTGLAVASWFLAPWAVAFFTQTKLGRYIGAGAVAVFGIWLIAVRIFSAGRAKEREIVRQNNERREQKTEERQNELQKIPDSDLPRRASRWVRD